MQVNKIYSGKVIGFQGTDANNVKPNTKIKNDEFVASAETKTEPPKISYLSIITGLMSDEQVAQINSSRKLPDNAKFVPDGMGGFLISPNYFSITSGTHDLPVGFEVKKRKPFGFVCVVPNGTKGFMIR